MISQLAPALERLARSATRLRLLKGAAASLFTQIATVAIQFITLPILLHAWGGARYGLWLVLSAVPVYLAMGDFGFAQAAANDMTAAVARGDGAGANRTQQSVLVLVALICAVILLLAATVLGLAPMRWFAVAGVEDAAATKWTLFLLIASTVFLLTWSCVSAAFRADGRFAAGTFAGDLIRLAEAAGISLGALCGGGLVTAASASALIRLAGLLAGLIAAHRSIAWFRLGLGEARSEEVRRLLRPALAVTALPIGFAISLQGITLVTAQALGLAAVPVLNATRTFSRLIVQAATVISYPVIPEVSRAFGLGDRGLLVRLVTANVKLTLALTLALTVLELLFGRFFIALWTGHKIDPGFAGLAVIVLAAALQALWLSNSTMLLALNRQTEYSYRFVACAALSVAVAMAAAKAFGLTGIGAAMVLGDAIMLAIVMPRVLRLTRPDQGNTLPA